MEAERVERATKASRAFALVAAPALLALVALPWWGDAGWMRLIAEMAYYLALAQLWNLLAGYAGLVSVGQQAYVGLGGYALFYLTGAQNMNVYLALAIAGPFAGLIAIPVSFAVFRLRGAYFAVGTWVMSEVFALSASLIAVLGAGSGLSLTPAILRQISPDRGSRDAILYLMSLAISVVVCAIVYLLLRSRHGLALTAIRDSEPASASLGVNTFRTKFIIYVATAACTGLIGGLIFLQKLRISPEAGFSINDWTVVVIFMVVIGGIGTIEGPFIGMLVYITLRELLADYGTIYLILMGMIAIAVMLKAPSGIWGWVVQRYDVQLFPVGRRLVLAPPTPPQASERYKQRMPPFPTQSATKQEIMDRVRAMAPRFAGRAAAAEEARRIPEESVKDMLDAGFARILVPKSVGGYGLGFDTWFEVTRELCKADASHGWCASLIIHHNHLIAQYPRAAQTALWANGLDVPVAASFAPATVAVPVDGGYRISGKGSPFASGVDHCTWVMLGGMAQDGDKPEWKFFLVAPGDYGIRDTWFTAGMRGTGSKTIVTDNAFVPSERVLKLTELRDAKTPGGAMHGDTIFHTPFFYYAPISFATPMLGAAQGAYEHFRDWTKTRQGQDGSSVAEKTSVQVRMARAAADLDAADLLLRRAVNVTDAPQDYSPNHLARSVRDFARVSELTVAAIDTLVALSGTASFNTSHPLQRAWRDIHFMSMHIAVNTEMNFSHYGRMELGLGRDASRPYF